jgi:thiosulfate/3-mercaptopyruvate sulfurtransferase
VKEKGYAHPEALVSTDWVAEHLDDTENVRNYDGSWTEWGNAVRVPIER